MEKIQRNISWIAILKKTYFLFFQFCELFHKITATYASELKESDQWHVLTNLDTKIFRAAVKHHNFLPCFFSELISGRTAFNTHILAKMNLEGILLYSPLLPVPSKPLEELNVQDLKLSTSCYRRCKPGVTRGSI